MLNLVTAVMAFAATDITRLLADVYRIILTERKILYKTIWREFYCLFKFNHAFKLTSETFLNMEAMVCAFAAS
jgi:hypothetical protein